MVAARSQVRGIGPFEAFLSEPVAGERHLRVVDEPGPAPALLPKPGARRALAVGANQQPWRACRSTLPGRSFGYGSV
jgi:hypothetical protein